jgi:hypothetical protein
MYLAQMTLILFYEITIGVNKQKILLSTHPLFNKSLLLPMVAGSLRVLQFPPPLKLVAMI